MKQYALAISVAICLLSAPLVFAESDLDDAVAKTQADLRNHSAVESHAQDSQQVKQALETVKSVGGSQENQKEIMDLAADVLGNMKDKSPEEMIEILNKAQQDPAGFSNSWSSEQKRKLEDIAKKSPMNK